MKINVKALLLWGIIFPFIISTIPMRKSSDKDQTRLKLSNTFLNLDALEQILDYLDVSINGTYGKFIHNNVDNSIVTIDRDLRNNRFGIIYYSNEFVDNDHLIATILIDEKNNQVKLHEMIYQLLIEYIEGGELPDDFKIKTKVIIPNKRISTDMIKAYALEIETHTALINSLTNHIWSNNPEENIKGYLNQLEAEGSIKISVLPNEI